MYKSVNSGKIYVDKMTTGVGNKVYYVDECATLAGIRISYTRMDIMTEHASISRDNDPRSSVYHHRMDGTTAKNRQTARRRFKSSMRR